jgi:hypothetical protein
MKKFFLFGEVAVLLVCAATTTSAQNAQPLKLVQTIPMPNVKGRIDHMDVDVPGKRLFVSGLENGSVEVVDLQAGRWTKSIPGLLKPQGIAYVSGLNKLFVASGDDGMVRVFRGDTLDLLDSIKLELGPNRVAYDAARQVLYVGYGLAPLTRAPTKRFSTCRWRRILPNCCSIIPATHCSFSSPRSPGFSW